MTALLFCISLLYKSTNAGEHKRTTTMTNLLAQDTQDTLKSWDLTRVNVDGNNLIASQRPTTQEDNFGQIISRWDLYNFPNKLFNGILCDIRDGKDNSYKCGHLVLYNNGHYAYFNGMIKFNLSDFRIEFSK